MEPYLDTNTKSIIFKPPIASILCSVHGTRRNNRGMKPIVQRTRCVEQGSIHEIIIVEERVVKEKGLIEETAYIGFTQFLTGGLLECGDSVYLNNMLLGELAGFDDTHMPNHLNILVQRSNLVTGIDLKCSFSDLIIFYGKHRIHE
jgi:hypothetical protein